MIAPSPASTNSAATCSPADLLYGDFRAEHAATRRMLERYPAGKNDWRPHPKSRPLAELATHVADIVNRGTAVLTTDVMEIGARKPLVPLTSAADLLAHFETSLARFNAALATATYEQLEQSWSIRRDGRVLAENPRRIFLRLLMSSHLAHHRAQLGVYYRLLDVAVPGMYGPSADD